MILNVTNCKMMQKVSGSEFVEDWAGVTVTISVEKVHAWGEWVDCLRIKPDKPKAPKTKTPVVKKIDLPELTEDHERYPEAVKGLKSGKVAIIGIEKSF